MDRDPASARAADAQADLALVQAALRGDAVARQRLVERLAVLPSLLRARHRRLGSPLSADQLEDVTQSVLLALWQKLAMFDGRVPLPAWALGFGSLELLRAMHRSDRERQRHRELPDLADPRGGAVDEISATEHLAAMLDRLTAQDLEILQHKHVAGRTFAEIGELLDWPVASVKTRYYRALEAVRRRLPDDDGAGGGGGEGES